MVQNFTRTELIIWTIAFAVESLAIIVGNSVTIAVFWKQRLTLKRTRYLLINLSVADLLIGACVNEDIVCFPLNDACKVSQKNKSGWRNVWNGIFVIFSSRCFGKTIRHRLSFTTPNDENINLLLFYWSQLDSFSNTYHNNISTFAYFSVNIIFQPMVISAFTVTCLIVICVAYLTILIYSKKEDPRMEINRWQHNKKLAKTLSIVTLLSIMTWLPHGVTNVLRYSTGKEEGEVYLAGQFCRMANSFVNPIVYCYRMPEFRKILRKLFACKTNNRDALALQNQ